MIWWVSYNKLLLDHIAVCPTSHQDPLLLSASIMVTARLSYSAPERRISFYTKGNCYIFSWSPRDEHPSQKCRSCCATHHVLNMDSCFHPDSVSLFPAKRKEKSHMQMKQWIMQNETLSNWLEYGQNEDCAGSATQWCRASNTIYISCLQGYIMPSCKVILNMLYIE